MADVRLTATNPEDSSVVPVACNADGRLLLEEMPPAFDGTVDGDLTVSGKGSFAGGKSIIGNDGSAQFAQGAVDIYANGTVEFTQNVNFDSATFAGNVNFDSATFTDQIIVGELPGSGGDRTSILPNGTVQGINDGSQTWLVDGSSGQSMFARNKAGFTAEGYLYCTTRRGDTVILDATSNGLASWVEYTPTSRIDDLRDRLDANRGDTGEMPTDTP